MAAVVEVDYFHHFHQFVELFGNLLEHLVVAAGNDGHAREGRVFGGGYGKRVDVVAARGKEADHAAHGAGFVFHQNG